MGDTTGVGGVFSVTILQGPLDPIYTPGSYFLEINPLPGSLAIAPLVNLGPTGATLGTFMVAPGYIISGTLVDSFGVGLGGIDVDINPDSGGDPDPIVTGDTSDASGAFAVTMEQLPTDYAIKFSPPAPTPAPTTCVGNINPTSNPPCAFGILPVALPPTFIFGNVNLGTITMPNAACLSATIVNASGVPLPGLDAQVSVVSTGLNVPLNEDNSDCFGKIKIMVPLGEIDLLFRDPVPELGGPILYAPVLFPGLLVTGDMDVGTVVMDLGHNISGTITRQNGTTPIAGAEIEFFDTITGALTPQANDVTNVAGAFTYFVPNGTYLCEIDPPLALVATVVPTRVPVTVSGVNMSIGTVALLDGFRITGHCVDDLVPAGNVGNVDVAFQITGTSTRVEALHENAGATGNFVTTIVPNTYDVFLLPPLGSGRAPTVVSPVALTAAVNLGDVVLGPGVSLTGTVTSGLTPVEGAVVELAGAINYDNVSDLTGAYGYQVIAGTYDVTVTPPFGSLDPPLTILGVAINGDTVLDFDLTVGPSAVTSPVCVGGATNANLSWSVGPVVPETVTILRGGVVIATVPGTQGTYNDPTLVPGSYTYTLVANRAGLSAAGVNCSVGVGAVPFIRGDTNLSGTVNLSDAIFMLAHLFQGQPASCFDALDVNDSGSLNIADVIGLLSYLFSGGAAPPPPFPTAGTDPTPDGLTCP